MVRLELTPQASSYEVNMPNEVVTFNVAGGMPRQRRDSTGGYSTANVEWLVDRTGFDSLVTFFKSTTEYGSLDFEMDLILDNGDLTPYTCRFVEDSCRASIVSGLLFKFSAKLYVKPNATETDQELECLCLFCSDEVALQAYLDNLQVAVNESTWTYN